ncbi:MAG: hypothetical protein ACLQQ4_07510 [Bacteroidia bacterium]
MRRILFCFCLCLMASTGAMANVVTAKASGNWNDANTWTGGIPTNASTVTVAGGYTVTVDASAAAICNTLTIGTAAAATGTVLMGESGDATPSFNGPGKLTITGTMSILALGTLEANPAVSGTSTLSVAGTVTYSTTGVIDMAPNATSLCNVTIDAAANSNLFSGTGTTAITLNNLTISNTGAAGNNTVTLGTSNVTIASNLTVSNGIFALAARTLTLSTGNATISSGTTLSVTTGSLTLTDGNVTNSGTINLTGTGGVTMNGASATFTNNSTGTITVSTTGGLTLNGSSSYVSNSGSITYDAAGKLTAGGLINSGTITCGTASPTISGAVSNSGTISISTGTFTLSGSSGNLTITGTGTLSFSGAGALDIAGNFINDGLFTENTSTVTFNGSANQSISGTSAITFYSLTINNSSNSNTVSLGSNAGNSITVSEVLTLTKGIFDVGSNTLNVQTTFTDDNTIAGSFNAETQTVNMSGATINGTNTNALTFYNLNCNPGTGNTLTVQNNPVSPAAALIISNNLIISSGTFAIVAKYVEVEGDFTNNAAFTATTGTIDMNGTSSQTIGGTAATTTFGSLDIENTGSSGNNVVFLAQGMAITINHNVDITNGVLNCQTTSVTGNATGTFQMSSGTFLILGLQNNATTVSFPSAFTAANTTLSAGSTVVYQADAASQIISVTQTYANLCLYTGSTASTITLSGTPLTVAGSLDIGDSTSGGVTLSAGTNTIKLTGAGTSYNCLINSDGNITFSGAGTLDIADNFINNSTLADAGFSANTSTVDFDGTTAQSLGGSTATTFDNLTIDNTNASGVTLGKAITVSATLLLSNSAGHLDVGANNSVTVDGTFDNANTTAGAASFNAENGTVTFGTGATAISGAEATTFYNVNIDVAAIGTVSVTSTAAAPTEIISNALTLTSGTFAIAAKTIDLGGNLTNNATATSFSATTGTLVMDGSGAATQIIGGSAASTAFYNLIIDPVSNGTVQLGMPITVNGLLTLDATATLDVSVNDYGITCIKGWTNNGGTFNGRKGIVLFDGAQTLGGTASTTFNDVNIENGLLTISTAPTIQDTLQLLKVTSAGTFNNSVQVTIGNAFLNNSSTAFADAGAGIIEFTGNSFSSNYIGGSSGGTAAAITLKSLTVDLAHQTDVLYLDNEGITVKTALAIDEGILHCQKYNITGNAAGTFKMSAGTELVLGMQTDPTVVAFPSAYTAANITLTAGSTVIYQTDGGAQVISLVPTAYANLYLYSGSTAGTKTIAGNLTVDGNLTVGDSTSGGVTLTAVAHTVTVGGNVLTNSDGTISFSTGTFTITGNLTNNGTDSYTGTGAFGIQGNFTNNGTFTPVTTVATFNGTSTQTIGGTSTTSFYGLTISGTDVILAHNEIVTQNVSITSGTFDGGTGAYTLSVEGNFSDGATFTGDNGTVIMDGSAAQSIGGTETSNFYNLTINPSVGVTVSAGISENVSNNLQVSTGIMANTTYTLTVGGGVTIDNASTLSFSTGALKVGGNFSNSGTFTAGTSTTTFNGTATQTISGSSVTSFNNVNISGTDVVLGASEAANATATAFLSVNTGIFDLGAGGYTMSVAGNFTNSATFNGENGTLGIGGNFSNGGTFNEGTGTVKMNGTSAQSIGGGTAVTFYNLTIASTNTVTLSTSESFSNILTMNSGTLAASGSNTMTLLSNASATACVGTITGGTITANFIVQRYLPRTMAAYMSLSSPVYSPAETGTTSISGSNWTYYYGSLADWNINNRTSTDATFYMSGVHGPDGNAGSYTSVYNYTPPSTYTAISANFSSPSAANDYVIPQGGAVYLWIGYSLSKMAPYSYITHGVPVQGTIAAGSGFVGNPYPSSINWATFSAHNGLASYQVYTSGGSWTSSTSNIAMGQGFEVSGAVSFLETDKVVTAATLDAPDDAAPLQGNNIVTFTLYNDANEYWTPAIVSFGKNYSTSYNQKEDDALFLSSLLPDVPPLYTVSEDNKNLELNRLPDSAQAIDVPLTAIGVVSANYTLAATGLERLSSYNCVTLIDKSSGRILANFEDSPDYTFTVSNPGEVKNYILRFTRLAPGQTCQNPDGISEINILPGEINIIPDESGATVKFNLTAPCDAIVSVFNVLGQKIVGDITTEAYNNSLQLNLPAGQIYIVRVQTPEGLVTKRIYH